MNTAKTATTTHSVGSHNLAQTRHVVRGDPAPMVETPEGATLSLFSSALLLLSVKIRVVKGTLPPAATHTRACMSLCHWLALLWVYW